MTASGHGGAVDQGAGSHDFDTVYPRSLREGEGHLIEQRRQKGRRPATGPHAPPANAVGFGLSGGGIRSATFCLGLFQGLAARPGLLDQVDFLSTVSGGGYFGSFLGRLFTRGYVRSAADVEATLRGEKNPQVLSFLRENGRYLSPNGGGDTLLFGAVILRNLVSVHLVLAVFVLAVLLGVQVVRSVLEAAAGSGWPDWLLPSAGPLWWSPFVLLPLAVFALVSFPLGWAYWLVEPEKSALRKGAEAPPGAAAGPTPPPHAAAAPRRGAGQQILAAARLARSAVESSPVPPLAGLALILVTCLWLAAATAGEPVAWLWGTLAATAAITIACWLVARAVVGAAQAHRRPTPGEEEMDLELFHSHAERNLLGRWLTVSLVFVALLLAVGLVDTLGQTLYLAILGRGVGAWLAGFASTAALLVAFSQRFAVFFARGSDGKRPTLPVKWLATAAALLLVTLWLVCLSTVAHAVAWELDRPRGAHRFLAGLAPGKDEPLTLVLPRSTERAAVTLRDPRPVAEVPSEGERQVWPAFLGFAGTLLLSILFGQTWPFLNRSTQQPTYGARLTRAYLGASNESRWAGNNVTQPVAGDDYDLARYWPPPAASGAPLHLINVTINETVDGHSQVQQQDRKGLGMALGPRGLSAGARHHAVMPLGEDQWMNPTGAPVEVFPEGELHRAFRYDPAVGFTGEMLPLGAWLSISGAAFSTGTGMRTSLGLSLLTGLGNVRLGRWWDSGVAPPPQPAPPAPRRKWSLRFEDWAALVFPVQTYLLDEMLARFPGTARRHWYLSDGGHFENLGGYELIRRRLPLIVIVDAEMDADYAFGGLANLIRKARLDFGAEIEFLDANGLDAHVTGAARRWLGTLDQLRRGEWHEPAAGEPRRRSGTRLAAPDLLGYSRAHAALARVSYRRPAGAPGGAGSPPRSSWLLYVKPTLVGDEPADVLEYHRAHPKFPHEPTADQFFDEAQWESYRRLGEHVAESLFGEVERLLDGGPGKALLRPSELGAAG
jgi:hypothetical protein